MRFFLTDRAVPLLVVILLTGTGAAGYWGFHHYSIISESQRQASSQTATQSVGEAAVPQNDAKPDEKPAPRMIPSSSLPELAAVRKISPAPQNEAITAPETAPAQPATARESTLKPNEPIIYKKIAPPAPTPHLREENPGVDGSETIWTESEPGQGQEPESDVLYDESPDEPEPEPEPEETVAQVPAFDPSLPVLSNSGLSLQAISWSSVPKERLAVVNGSICREGDRVDKFIIRRINTDDILLDDGRKTWTLLFQLK